MPKRKAPTNNIVPPALTADTAERLCEDAAYRLAQKQLEDGTASPSVIVHFLRTKEAKLNREKLEKETDLLRAKKVSIENGEKTKEMMEDAIKAIRTYQGTSPADEDDYEDYDDDDY